MPKLDWYKRNPSKFLAATMGWTAEQKGIYSTLLDLMYDRAASLDDAGEEAGKLARICGVSTYRFRIEVGRLLALNKLIRAPNGRLSNRRFERLMGENGGKLDENPGENSQKTPKKTGEKNTEKNADFPDHARQANALAPTRAHAHESRAREHRTQNTESRQSHNGEKKPDPIPVETKLARVCKILNVRLESDTSRAAWPRQLIELEAAGLDFEQDIVPAIQAFTGDRSAIRSLKYFTKAATERKTNRETAAKVRTIMDETVVADVSSLSPDQWVKAMVSLGQSGIWNAEVYGPPPTRPGCLAPPDLIARFLEVWTAQGSHPLQEFDATDQLVDYPAARPDLERRARWMP